MIKAVLAVPSPAGDRPEYEVAAPGTGIWDVNASAVAELGTFLKSEGYKFTTVTPATHAQVISRPRHSRPTQADIFGWSCKFAREDVSEDLLNRMTAAGILSKFGTLYQSSVRFSTLGELLFAHSAFPTEQHDSVFFGPDTYRFARLIRHFIRSLETLGFRRGFKILDVGAGSGAGGLYAAIDASRLVPAVTLSDINRRALRFCMINAAINRVPRVHFVESDLYSNLANDFDLIIANPPYLVDPLARAYRHGGGELGFDLSLRVIEQGLPQLASGGRLVLYTGSAIVDGVDLFREALAAQLAGIRFDYDEIDPDVFGEELANPPYDRADRIAAVSVTIHNI